MANDIAKIEENKFFETDYQIKREGKEIILPNDPKEMSINEAIKTLLQKKKDEEQVYDIHEIIEAVPNDALVALNDVLVELFGFISPKTQVIKGFFGETEIHPDVVDVKIGPKTTDVRQVVSGQMKLPNVEHPLQTVINVDRNTGKHQLILASQCRRREKQIVMDIARRVRDRLKTHSIYKAKAIYLKADSKGALDVNKIDFIETDHIVPEELIMNVREQEQLTASLWNPIMYTEACRHHRIPLNRGVLLEGIYGTGKTMSANVTARHCVDNGWTYILLDDVRLLKDGLMLAQRYQPAVIFAEDIDRAVAERDDRGNDILNTIDGILTKSSEVITVLTTNHVERLSKAMLRPGRLDSVISVHPPEPQAVERLLRLYGRDLIAVNSDLSEVGEALAGQIPATIREVVERSKLSMIGNGGSEVSAHDLLVASEGMKSHMELLREKEPDLNKYERCGRALAGLIEDNDMSNRLTSIGEKVQEILDEVA